MGKQTVVVYLLLKGMYGMSISFSMPIYVLFLISRGANLLETNIINASFALALLFAELPTGAMADAFGRKKSFIVACLVNGIGMIIYGFAQSFWFFVLAEVIIALGSTCASGAFQAWAIDRLNHYECKFEMSSLIAKESYIMHTSRLIGAFLGAWMAGSDMSLPWLAGGGLFFLTAAVGSLAMKEEYFLKENNGFSEKLGAMRQALNKGVRWAATNKEMGFVMILAAFAAFCVQAMNMQWQPLFSDFFPQKSAFGWIYAGIALSMIAGAWLSHRLSNFFNRGADLLLLVSLGIIGAGTFGAAIVIWLPTTMSFFLVHEIGRGMFLPLSETYVNKIIPKNDTKRATLLSLKAMTSHAGMILGLLASGFMAQYLSIRFAWLAISIFLFAGTFWIGKMIKNKI